MRVINLQSLKVAVPFKAGSLPRIDPADGAFLLDLGGVKIAGKVNGKAARKAASWEGGAVLQGKLIVEGGELVLVDAGFQFLEVRPVEVPAG